MAKPRQKNTHLEKTESLPIEQGSKRNPEALGLTTALLTKRLHSADLLQQSGTIVINTRQHYAVCNCLNVVQYGRLRGYCVSNSLYICREESVKPQSIEINHAIVANCL